MNWKLTLSYDGSAFHGWQIQPGMRTIQGTVAGAIKSITGENVMPQGSGRTDAGVHALAQVANVRLEANIPANSLLRALNRVLPGSIRLLAVEPVPESFHARHSARDKTYEYRLFERRVRLVPGEPAAERICSPFLAPFVWDCRWPLTLERMQQAATHFVGTHDFTSFAAADPDLSDNAPNPVKTIHVVSVERSAEPANPQIVFRFVGSGFLHHMVRNLVGTLVDVGRGAMEPDEIPGILAARNRTAAGPTAPARGLFLVHVKYEAELIGENSQTA